MIGGPRQLALKAGEKFYIGGRACKSGHNGPRYTTSGQCVACQRYDGNAESVDRRSGRHAVVVKSCLNCGGEMSRRNQRHRDYCSHKCCNAAGAGGWRAIGDRTCRCCGGDFRGRSAQFYCSDPCKKTASTKYASTFQNLFGRLLRMRAYGREKLSREFLFELLERQDGKCAISGVKLTCECWNGVVNTNASIDRKDSSIGYEPSNVQLVCRIINVMKTDLSEDGFVEWCQRVVDYAKT